jgi:hypothetical protein
MLYHCYNEGVILMKIYKQRRLFDVTDSVTGVLRLSEFKEGGWFVVEGKQYQITNVFFNTDNCAEVETDRGVVLFTMSATGTLRITIEEDDL